MIFLLGVLMWVLYLLGYFVPESTWGFHQLAFIPTFNSFIFLAISFLLIVFPFVQKDEGTPFHMTIRSPRLLIVWVAVISGLVYYSFPFAASLIGDAEFFNKKLGDRTTELFPLFWEKFLSPNIFHPKTGNTTVISGIRLMSYYFDLSHAEAYRLLGAFSGGAFVFLWLQFVSRNLKDQILVAAVSLCGIFAPFSQFFFGYEEIYAPAYPVLLGFLMAQIAFFRNPTRTRLAVQIVMLFLCLKIHSVFNMLVPAFVLSLLYYFIHQTDMKKRFTLANSVYFVLLPIITVGMIVYFFVLKDHVDPRTLGEGVDIYERLFLPILSPNAPLDRYNMFSLNHILDYLNLPFQWTAAGFILILFGLMMRQKVNWNRPELVSMVVSSVMMSMIYFAYNPLMSMPLDIDLFSLPGPILLVLGVLILRSLEDHLPSKSLAGPLLASCFLVIPIYQVNASSDSLSYRMESVGRHVFKTYWIRSAGDIFAGMELRQEFQEETIQRYEQILSDLKPYVNPGLDVEYANIVWQLATYHRVVVKAPESALIHHRKVFEFDPGLHANHIGMVESHYQLQQFDSAQFYAQKLVEFEHPNKQKSLRIAIDCSAQVADSSSVVQYSEQYLKEWEDSEIAELKKRFSISGN